MGSLPKNTLTEAQGQEREILGRELLASYVSPRNQKDIQATRLELIARGADLALKNDDGYTALHLAIINDKKGDLAVCKAMLAAGARVDAQTARGRTAIQLVHDYRYGMNYHSLLSVLTKAEYILEERSEKLVSLLAQPRQDMPAMLALIEAGVSTLYRNDEGESCLRLAVSAGNLDICKALIKAGASIENENSYNSYALADYAPEGSEIAAYLDSRTNQVAPRWIVFDAVSVAEVSENRFMHLQLCSVFNMATREKTIISRATDDIAVHHTQPQSFDDLPPEHVERAISFASRMDLNFDEDKARGVQGRKTVVTRLIR